MQISLHITRQFNFTLYILGRVSRIIVSPVVWFRPARGTAWMTRILTGFIIAIAFFTRTWTRRNRGQTPPFVRRFGRAWRLTPFRLLFFNMLLMGVVMNWFGCESQENTLLYLIEVCEVKSMLKIFRIERRNKCFEPKCTFLSKNNIFSVGSRDVTRRRRRQWKRRRRRRQDDDDGSENVAKKMNLPSFRLNRFYLDPLNMSNAGDFFWSWIRQDFIQVQKEKGKFVVVCPRPP